MPLFTSYTNKATPADSDEFLIGDSAASLAAKNILYGSLKTAIADHVDSAQRALGALPEFNVRRAVYGAAGNGSTDDTAAFISAIEACSAAGGGTVVVPKGDYLINTNNNGNGITINPDAIGKVSIRGDGYATRIVKGANLTNRLLSILGGGDSDVTNPAATQTVIRDLSFIGLTTTDVYGRGDDNITNSDNGVTIRRGVNCAILNCLFQNFGDSGLRLTTTESATETTDTFEADTLVFGNVFNNVWQTSTTNGGSRKIIWANNRSKSVNEHKFSCEVDVSGTHIIMENVIEEFWRCAVGLQNTRDVIIAFNQFLKGKNLDDNNATGGALGIVGNAIQLYRDPSVAVEIVQENISIVHNIMRECSGIFGATNTTVGTARLKNLKIHGNHISALNAVRTNGAIRLEGIFEGLDISNNTIEGLSASQDGIGISHRTLASHNIRADFRFQNNTITGGKLALSLTGSGNDTPFDLGVVSGNIMRGAAEGWDIRSVSNFTFSNNIVEWTTSGFLFEADNSLIYGNRFTATSTSAANYGLYIGSGFDSARIYGNVFSAGGSALAFGNASGATNLDGNLLLQNTFVGARSVNYTGVINYAVVTVNPGSIAAGAVGAPLDVTVPGAAVGDFVEAAPGVSLAGLMMTSYVSATNTVTVLLRNDTASPVDLASSSWHFRIIKRL